MKLGLNKNMQPTKLKTKLSVKFELIQIIVVDKNSQSIILHLAELHLAEHRSLISRNQASKEQIF